MSLSPETPSICELAHKLASALEPAQVITAPEQLSKLGGDKWFASHAPDLAVFPRSAEEVAEALRLATAYGVPITPRGAAYGYVGGCVPVRGGLVISTQAMNTIFEIHPQDFVARVQPGVITGDLQRQAAKKNLFYPPDPASLDHCSIGGNIATNAGGPRCLKYGVTRNYVLGLQVALSDGTLVQLGGRTHKNKTGLDLLGLFVGSEGLLGIVTEATLKLLPMPPARAVVSAGFASMKAAAGAVAAIFSQGFLPSAVEVADAFTLDAARQAATQARTIPPGCAYLLVEVDGQRASVRSEAKAIAALLQTKKAGAVTTALTPGACDALWDVRRGFSFALRDTGLTKLNEDIVVPRSRLVDLVEFASRLQKKSGFSIACFGHAGDGNIHVNLMAAHYEDPKVQTQVHAVLDKLFQQVLDWGGSITGEHGIGLAKLPWWEWAVSTEARALHQAIKRAVDPQHLLNPGKFL